MELLEKSLKIIKIEAPLIGDITCEKYKEFFHSKNQDFRRLGFSISIPDSSIESQILDFLGLN